MEVLAAAHTDIGITKQTNQDSLCVKIAKQNNKTAVIAVLCDGMGGLKKGELASAAVIREFVTWFEQTLPLQMQQSASMDMIKGQWNQMIQSLNVRIAAYAEKQNLKMGTTLTGILLIDYGYLIVNVGDSRTYRIRDGITQLTEDHSVVAREMKAGRLTKEQARTDPRRNVLVQCVGASRTVIPDFFVGSCMDGDEFLLCSDGFRHEISEQEICSALDPKIMKSENDMQTALIGLTGLNKQRKETDNISAALIKVL